MIKRIKLEDIAETKMVSGAFTKATNRRSAVKEKLRFLVSHRNSTQNTPSTAYRSG